MRGNAVGVQVVEEGTDHGIWLWDVHLLGVKFSHLSFEHSSGDELELVGGLGGAKFGVGGIGRESGRSRQTAIDVEDADTDENDGMELN